MPTAADPFFTWLSTLRDLAISSMLLVVLYGGAKRWWCFGYQLIAAEKREADCKAEYEARLAAALKREDQWKELALSAGQVAKESVGVLRRARRDPQ